MFNLAQASGTIITLSSLINFSKSEFTATDYFRLSSALETSHGFFSLLRIYQMNPRCVKATNYFSDL